jgi:hypothetical protein
MATGSALVHLLMKKQPEKGFEAFQAAFGFNV